MNVGEIYFWEQDVPYTMKEIKWRYFKVLSVTLTHVYVKNLKTGLTRNKSIETFQQNYKLVKNTDSIKI